MNATSSVTVRREPTVFSTYLPAPPERHPMFLEQRVYQGSCGSVYPLPFHDRIAEKPTPHAWDTITLENEFIEVVILPEIGGRIHRLRDKTNGYDALYHQPVIKPALVGLAGPWMSGGIEFNWPQHHRPSTFMPTDVHIEPAADGSVTVWLSEHDPLARMKGMHGVCLRPGRAVLEVKARCHNRTDDTQTFLWWANAATRVHESYQSFFPPDVMFVADHAKRATSTFPLCSGHYYGIDYGARARRGRRRPENATRYRPGASVPPNDLSWYANIPVPTSYMAMGSSRDFFGGYDHRVEAGLLHVADHHIAPGKKQWTWGNHPFGYAWDRNLTDADEHGEHRPYIELMAGVYTDNQPDFSFLAPGETKSWSQFWYPFQRIGPVVEANTAAALSLRVAEGRLQIGVAVTARYLSAIVTLRHRGREIARYARDLAPDAPLIESFAGRGARSLQHWGVTVTTATGEPLLDYRWTPLARPTATAIAAQCATEPPPPPEIATADELHLNALHLEQYRHATRDPAPYWEELLRRDPGDSRAHLGLGRRLLRRGEFASAERHLLAAIGRLTHRNPNPSDGEAHYLLGLCLRHQGRVSAAADFLHKAAWNAAWVSPARVALAEIAASSADWPQAALHLALALDRDADNLRARNLLAIVLRQLGRTPEADALLVETLRRDPLDWWARHLQGEPLRCDNQVRLDLALDYSRAGQFETALALLAAAPPSDTDGTAPLRHYYQAWLSRKLDRQAERRRHLARAREVAATYCFPSRLEEQEILGEALATHPDDARAHALLGYWLYHRRRHREALRHWQLARRNAPDDAAVLRCIGIASYNIARRPRAARAAYLAALRAAPTEARLLYEFDQLCKRLGESPAQRLARLSSCIALVRQRDDLTVEFATLLNLVGRPADALRELASRRFQPWEGGEGLALAQYTRACLQLCAEALAAGRPGDARGHAEAALVPPDTLGEARHPLANESPIRYWLGEACLAAGDRAAARNHWTLAAANHGDFQQMVVTAFSASTYFSILALQRLGRRAAARRLLAALRRYAHRLARKPAKVDYFATSLPALLLFREDLDFRQRQTAALLRAQAAAAAGDLGAARTLAARLLRSDPAMLEAHDLLSAAERR